MAKNSQTSGYTLPKPLEKPQNTESDQANGVHGEAGAASAAAQGQNNNNDQGSNGASPQEFLGTAKESSISVAPSFYPEEQSDTSTRDFSIGFGVLMVLMIAFWFVKNAYANSLVAKRITPRSANTAGLCLWFFLTTLSAGIILSIINPDKFITINYMGALGVLGVIFFVLMFVTGRR